MRGLGTPGDTHLRLHYLWQAPRDISPNRANAVAGPALAVLIMIAGLTSAGPPGPHSLVTEGERERAQTWDSAFIEVEGGVPRVSQDHSLLVNLKQRARIKT